MNIKEILEHPIVVIGTYILIIFFVVASAKSYLWYLTVQQTILANEQKDKNLQERIAYMRNYRLEYLNSEIATYFIAHENGIANPNEQIIKIEKASENQAVQQQIVSPNGDIKKLSPQQTWWKGYLQYKIEKASQ
jgi:hypothetical protein